MNRATLNGSTVTRARVQVPAWGAPWADVEVDSAETLTGVVTLAIADIEISATVASGGPTHGRARYRLVGGHAGWGRPLPAKAYRDDAGVRVRTVVRDAAREAGEALGDLPSTRLGPHYARPAGSAVFALNGLFPQVWYVDFAGVTRLEPRAVSTYTGNATRTRTDLAAGVVELAVDSLVGLVPGVTVDGLGPASDVEYELDDKRLAVRVYAARVNAAGPRRVAHLARIVDALDPWRRYRATYEFRVIQQAGAKLDLQPVRAATGLPILSGVPIRPGMAGLDADVLPGSLVLVTFIDGDPSRPCATSFDDPDSPGWIPVELCLGAGAVLGVARMTDPVQAGPFAGTITLGSLTVKGGA